MTADINMIEEFYAGIADRQDNARKALNRPLTYAEKILYSHLWNAVSAEYSRGVDYVELAPDRAAMQDTTAQMALLQFMHAGRRSAAVPATVHTDHLIVAQYGSKPDLEKALSDNKEVYDFLESACRKFGVGFWKPGAGIIHQVILENYAFPGGMMIGSDSHTPNAGGLGMIGIGVGGADIVDAIAGIPWELKWPGIIGVELKGKLSGWTSPKDVILKLAGLLTVKGATNKIIEYFGEGTKSISCTGKATICNMGAEAGATCSLFPYDERMNAYLIKTNRRDVAELAEKNAQYLKADDEALSSPEKYFDKVITIDLDELEPHLNGPYTPDAAIPVSKMKEAAKEKNFPDKLSAALIGSCTNSSYEDIDRAADVARQALAKGLKAKSVFTITPGSEQVRASVERDGQLKILTDFGGVVLANACGPCVGMWKRSDNPSNERNSIAISFNRNFARRNDGNPDTLAFIAGPELTTALAAAGKLTFNPITDELINDKGEKVKLNPPCGDDLPSGGFIKDDKGFIAPAEEGYITEVNINPSSERLQFLERFAPWDGRNPEGMKLLIKVKGKCTTDHISPAGSWLNLRGHLDNLSRNLLLGAINSFTGRAGEVKNQLAGKYQPVHEAAREYKARDTGWIVVGEDNYGEGSAREQAAMEPRHLGGKAIIVKSFARIHETNLKKQGMLPLTFANPDDYDKIKEDDTFCIKGLDTFEAGKPFTLLIRHSDGSDEEITLNHTINKHQFEWFRAGSALNLIAQKNK